jgi:hypothetical protein
LTGQIATIKLMSSIEKGRASCFIMVDQVVVLDESTPPCD